MECEDYKSKDMFVFLLVHQYGATFASKTMNTRVENACSAVAYKCSKSFSKLY